MNSSSKKTISFPAPKTRLPKSIERRAKTIIHFDPTIPSALVPYGFIGGVPPYKNQLLA